MLTRQQALDRGYHVDPQAPGRPVAYLGANYNPQNKFPILTDLEAELLAAAKNLRAQLREHVKFDVRKHFSLMVADATINAAIYKAEET